MTSHNVIAHKMYSRSDVIHTMLWPSLVVVACAVVFILIETRRRRTSRITLCDRRIPPLQEEVPVALYELVGQRAGDEGPSTRRPWRQQQQQGRGVHTDGCCAAGEGGRASMAPGYRTLVGECGCRFVYRSLPSLGVEGGEARNGSQGNSSRRPPVQRSLSADQGCYVCDDDDDDDEDAV